MFQIIARVKAAGVLYADAGWSNVRALDTFGDVVVEGTMDQTELDNFNNSKDCVIHFPFEPDNVKTQMIKRCHIIEIVLRPVADTPKQEKTMEKWEYWVVDYLVSDNQLEGLMGIKNLLNRLGGEGWRVIHVAMDCRQVLLERKIFEGAPLPRPDRPVGT